MKFTAATALAALAAVVSGAAIQRRGDALPARFSLEIVSDSPVVNGLRVRYRPGDKFSFVDSNREAIFVGQSGHAVLDSTIFPIIDTQFDHGGPRELTVLLYGLTSLALRSAEAQAESASTGGKFVSGFTVLDGMLRPVDAAGKMLDLKWFGCGDLEFVPVPGTEDEFVRNDIFVMWNAMTFEVDCPAVQLKVVEL